jgi:hypothetical protein
MEDQAGQVAENNGLAGWGVGRKNSAQLFYIFYLS